MVRAFLVSFFGRGGFRLVFGGASQVRPSLQSGERRLGG